MLVRRGLRGEMSEIVFSCKILSRFFPLYPQTFWPSCRYSRGRRFFLLVILEINCMTQIKEKKGIFKSVVIATVVAIRGVVKNGFHCIRLKFHRAFRFPLHASRCYVPLTSIMLTTDAMSVTFFLYIVLVFIHLSQFTYRQKVNKHTFPIHNSSRMRREAWGGKTVWHIFEQNTSNHFSVHVGRVKREAWSSMELQP